LPKAGLFSFVLCCLGQPFCGSFFRNNRQHSDLWMKDVVEHADISDAKTVLGSSQSFQSFDSAPARLLGLVSQVLLDCVAHFRTLVRAQLAEILDSLRGQEDLKSHSG